MNQQWVLMFKANFLLFLKETSQQGTTIIYTSHHLSEAEDFCDQLLLISKGEIVAEGKTKELIQQNDTKNLESLFIKLTKAE